MKIQSFEKRVVAQQKGRAYMPQKSRIHIFTQGESIVKNLENRRQRPYTTYRKELIPEILERSGLSKDTKVSWSQKAGCACGCSPGFIIQDGPWGQEIFVTITD